ncbi:PAS domain-containing protein [Mycobacteroides abscessus]|uniref:hypothetical protein n=1 Tax=Mycobacteroides abscessus TaxID=36809 RepID=UPI000241D36D|nr:hypothetical protein [Mycobacteroides abscessus]ANO00861.1 hypothetical protein BAB74_20650 [Mycobacteroides abscessus]EHM17518.1 hypothetical protein MBOL_41040 [Mycobacteroides abscessus subsp. bolletii BD]MBN7301832.1 hypothetical protein [Mycobacteroides abscessus subsp. bolletii]MDO3069374.1 hypothetical protein [Mycobacteroides abscessus subsp. bolletii]MDO3128630.1 hypothetical protein [Mycobacteroides abscessus subsp. bolletii]
MRVHLFLVLAMITSLLMSACGTEKSESGPDDRNEVVASALARIEADLGKPVKLEVRNFHRAGDWAFLDGQLQDTNGQPVDYSGTPFAEAAANGGKSKRYDGLLKQTGPKWSILESAIGPTDVPWEGWKAKYPEAPAQIWP